MLSFCTVIIHCNVVLGLRMALPLPCCLPVACIKGTRLTRHTSKLSVCCTRALLWCRDVSTSAMASLSRFIKYDHPFLVQSQGEDPHVFRPQECFAVCVSIWLYRLSVCYMHSGCAFYFGRAVIWAVHTASLSLWPIRRQFGWLLRQSC